jgi:hypothetical protein
MLVSCLVAAFIPLHAIFKVNNFLDRMWGSSLKDTTHTASTKLLFLLTLLAVLLGGCGAHSSAVHKPAASTAQQEAVVSPVDEGEFEDEFELEDEFEAADTEPPIDPLSGYNRGVWRWGAFLTTC